MTRIGTQKVKSMGRTLQLRWPYAGVLLASALIFYALSYKRTLDLQQAREAYQIEQENLTQALLVDIKSHFTDLYQGLRTMTLLPGVKSIDRYGKNFQSDSKRALQQIYNNTYLNLKLSEVYILPAELHPNKWDATTGKMESPILSFDEFIVGSQRLEKNREGKAQDSLEEVEIFEYLEMEKQLQWLQTHFPNDQTFKGLEVPALISPPVVTCDNSDWTVQDFKNGHDHPRLGIVYTLPSYDEQGRFHGAVSGVVKLSVIEAMIPASIASIRNQSGTFYAARQPSDALKVFEQSNGIVKSGAIYASIHPLKIVDQQPWVLSIIKPAAEFWALPAIRQIENFFRISCFANILITVLGLLLIRLMIDNQRHLEQVVEEKTRQLLTRTIDMQMILDNADQGFLILSADGAILPEFSRVLERWFGPITTGEKVWDLLFRDPAAQSDRDFLKFAWMQIEQQSMPFEVSVEQLPKRFELNRRCFGLCLRQVNGTSASSQSYLLMVTDITDHIEAERADVHHREMLSVFQSVMSDRTAFVEFYADAERMVRQLIAPSHASSFSDQYRVLHTLKGNSAQFGLVLLAELCHRLETDLKDEQRWLNEAEKQALQKLWQEYSHRLLHFAGDSKIEQIVIDDHEIGQALQNIQRGASTAEVAHILQLWRLESVKPKLLRFATQAKNLATRLGKGPIDVEILDGNVRLEAHAFQEFWAALIHVIRNAIDHGLESQKDLNRLGKRGILTLKSSYLGTDWIQIEISDNGRGLDFDRIRKRALALGLPAATEEELIEAIFADSLSTQEEATELSGRGVGLAAVRAAVLESGGHVQVVTQHGQGTRFIFKLPLTGQNLGKVS